MTFMKTIVATAFVTLIAGGSPPVHAAKVDVPLPAEVKSAGYLTVGINCTYPPAGFVGIDGKPAGYEYTLVKRIAESALGTGDAALAYLAVSNAMAIASRWLERRVAVHGLGVGK